MTSPDIVGSPCADSAINPRVMTYAILSTPDIADSVTEVDCDASKWIEYTDGDSVCIARFPSPVSETMRQGLHEYARWSLWGNLFSSGEQQPVTDADVVDTILNCQAAPTAISWGGFLVAAYDQRSQHFLVFADPTGKLQAQYRQDEHGHLHVAHVPRPCRRKEPVQKAGRDRFPARNTFRTHERHSNRAREEFAVLPQGAVLLFRSGELSLLSHIYPRSPAKVLSIIQRAKLRVGNAS